MQAFIKLSSDGELPPMAVPFVAGQYVRVTIELMDAPSGMADLMDLPPWIGVGVGLGRVEFTERIAEMSRDQDEPLVSDDELDDA